MHTNRGRHVNMLMSVTRYDSITKKGERLLTHRLYARGYVRMTSRRHDCVDIGSPLKVRSGGEEAEAKKS